MGFKSPLFCNFYSLWFHSLPKRKTKPWFTGTYSCVVEVAESNLLKPTINSGWQILA
jgi:hypothetical protein